MLRLELNLGVFVVFLFLGCGGNSSTSSGTESALEQGCSSYANIYRYRESTCYGVAPEPDKTTLIARQTEYCVLQSSAPGSHVDATYWNTCAALANNNCGGYQCATYPTGALQTGEPCVYGTQCASLWCKGSLANQLAQCGVCATRLPEGAACDATTDACDIGTSCFQGFCRAKGQMGAACVQWSDCAPPTVCRASGVCGDVLFKGQPCTSSLDCTTDEGCDVTTSLCAPAQFGQPGASCDGEVNRCESGYCNRATGTCPTVIPDGSACDPSSPSAVCEVYSYCFGGMCKIPNAADCH